MRKENLFATARMKVAESNTGLTGGDVIPFSHEQFKRLTIEAKASFLSTLPIDSYNEYSDLITPAEREALREIVVKKRVPKYKALIPDGHLCMARVELLKDNGAVRVTRFRERQSVSVKFILEGRYSSRWVFEDVTFSCKDPNDRQGRAKLELGRSIILDILSCHVLHPELRVTAIDGLRCPIEIYNAHQWDDPRKPVVNRARTLSPNPMHPREQQYYDLSKRLEEEIPGWRFHPGSRAAERNVKRMDTREERTAKCVERAVRKMEAKA